MTTLFTELFPIQTDNLPRLHAYRVEARAQVEMNALGGGLPWRIQHHRSEEETWVWSRAHQCLFADAQCSEEDLRPVVEACWESGEDRFMALQSIRPAPERDPDAQAFADFVAWGVWHDVKHDLFDRLRGERIDVSPVHIRRQCTRSASVVDGTPALRLSIRSEITHENTLREIQEQDPDLRLEGLAVKDNTKDRNPLKGTIEGVVGTLRNHRERLLKVVSSDQMRDLLRSTDGEVPVVGVVPFGGKQPYDYVLGALDVIVQPRHYDQLNIPTDVQNKLTLSPLERSRLLQSVAQPLQEHGWIGKAFNSQANPDCFGAASSLGYEPKVRFGDGTVVEDESISTRPARSHGVVEPVSVNHSPVWLAILKVGDPPDTDDFGKQVQDQLTGLGLEAIQGKVFAAAATEKAVREQAQAISTGHFDAALALIPDAADAVYQVWKRETVSRNLPNQVLKHGTLGNRYAIDNIALGLFAKMGGVPYVLGEPLPYTDRVVGLDIGRVRKERADGTMSVAASTHLYGADGRLIGYRLEDASVEGETVPPDVLRRMFPPEAYAEKRILVHRDGPFRGEECETLEALGQDINSTFHLVEVRKQGAPRLYASKDRSIHQAKKGSYVRLNDHTAHVVSSPPPHSGSTAQPLQVRVRGGSLSIENAVHSVLSFTLMHHGSVRPPRLPVSLHYSDGGASRLQNGIRPSENKGRLPYWL